MWSLALLVAIATGTIALAWAWRRGPWPQGTRQPEPSDHGLTVPVGTTQVRGSLSAEQCGDGLSFVSVYPEGIRFRVLSEARWAFSDIDGIDVRDGSGGIRLVFSAGHRRASLEVFLPDARGARRLLQALPPTLPLSPRALALRNGSLKSWR